MTRGYLDEIEAQLVARTERLAERAPAPVPSPKRPKRPRPRREWLAVLPALVAAAAIIAIVLSTVASSGRTTPTSRRTAAPKGLTVPKTSTAVVRHGGGTVTQTLVTTPAGASTPATRTSSAPAGPVPAHFAPNSFTAISETTWWLLGTAPCSSPPCTSIVRTNDGGQSFVGIPAPRTTGVDQLRFADADNGFAYGPELWVTHNQGADWHQVNLGGTIVELAAGGNEVYAIVRATDGTGKLMRAPAGTDAWAAVPGAGDAFTGLWVYGADVMLESSSSAGQMLMISDDHGTSFAAHPAPPSTACQFEGQPPVIWAACASGGTLGIWRSTDDGGAFTASPSTPSMAIDSAFGMAGPDAAVVGYNQLYRTGDSGETYAPVGPSNRWDFTYIGFTDATHGVAIGWLGRQRALYYTTDGGQTYHQVTIGSS